MASRRVFASSLAQQWLALLLALFVHAALLAALFFGVQWKRQMPQAVSVELWQAPPAVAAPLETPPKPVAPPAEPRVSPTKPAPQKADIVEKVVQKKPPPPAETRASFDEELKREQKRLEQQARQRQQVAQAEAEARSLDEARARQAAAAAKQRGLNDYINKIRTKLRGNIVLPPKIQGNPEAVFEVTQLPGGEVMSVRLKKSSNNSALDAAIERAIFKSSPLPKPEQPEWFDRTLEISFKPLAE